MILMSFTPGLNLFRIVNPLHSLNFRKIRFDVEKKTKLIYGGTMLQDDVFKNLFNLKTHLI